MSIPPPPTTPLKTGISKTGTVNLTSSHPYRNYGLVAVLGAAAMAVAVFAPWLTSNLRSVSMTGWDISEGVTGSQQWYIGNMFDTFSPFFPGYTVLAVAALFGLASIGLMVARRTLGRATRLLMVVLPLVALTAVAMNLYSVFDLQDPKVVDLGWGLIVSVAGGFLAVVAIAYPGSRRTLTATPPR